MEIFAAVLNCQLWVTMKTKKEKRTHEKCVGPLIHVYTFISSKGEEYSDIYLLSQYQTKGLLRGPKDFEKVYNSLAEKKKKKKKFNPVQSLNKKKPLKSFKNLDLV